MTGTRRINQHLSFHVTVNVSRPPPPLPLAVRWPQHSSNQQISTVTLMSEIAYEGNLFPMVGPMINAHWQRVFPPGALLGRGSCVTPTPPMPPPPLLLTSHRGRDEVEMLPRVCAKHYATTRCRVPPWNMHFAFLLDNWRSWKRSKQLKLANWQKLPDKSV